MKPCLNCNKLTNNPKFCTLSCANSFNNRVSPKRKKINNKKCKICGKSIQKRSTYCRKCLPRKYTYETLTIADIHNKAKYQISAMIRNVARQIYKRSSLPKKCIVCGYDKHYEVCHKKSIKSFSNDTLIKVVNDVSNLVSLCPNHHWEYDRGILSLP